MKTKRKIVKWIKILDIALKCLLAFTAFVLIIGLGMFWYARGNGDVSYEFIGMTLLMIMFIPMFLLFIDLILISIQSVLIHKRGTKRYFTIVYRKNKQDYLRRGQSSQTP